jgi:TonB family protein
MMRKRAFWILVMTAPAACGKPSEQGGSFQTIGRQPDVAPVMLNKELPFRYPPALFAQKVQGNVTLRIYIDRTGQIVPESTHVAETSGFTALDSAAVKGSRELKFTPAKTQTQPVPVSILLPVFFRHPGAPPLPGDSVLKLRQVASSTSAVVPQAATSAADTTSRATAAVKKPTATKATAKPKKKRTAVKPRRRRRR